MKKLIEYICEGCNAGRCRAITEDDGYPPDSCLYGGGTKEWSLVEEPDRCPRCGSREREWHYGTSNPPLPCRHPWHDTQKQEKCPECDGRGTSWYEWSNGIAVKCESCDGTGQKQTTEETGGEEISNG